MPRKIVADDSLFFLFLFLYCFPEKIRLDISCESSARQMIHMQCQALSSLKILIKNNDDDSLVFKSLSILFFKKKGKRKVQRVPQSQTAALPRHQEEEETDKTKQAQTEQT